MKMKVASNITTKRFLCMECDSRIEEEIKDNIWERVICLNCGSKKVLPFAESDGLRLHHAKCGGNQDSEGCEIGGCAGCVYNENE